MARAKKSPLADGAAQGACGSNAQAQRSPTSGAGQAPADASRDDLISAYLAAGLPLVPIPAGQKGPTATGWNLPENCINTPAQAARLNGNCNIGLAHAYGDPPTGALDIDDVEKARAWLADRGIDLGTLLAASDAVRIIGREERAKLLFRLPAVMPGKKVKAGGKDIIDFRCASQGGLTVQDVLPPSVHPDTGLPYRLSGDISKIPPIPPELLRIWRELIDAQPAKTTVGSDDSGLPPRFVELLKGDDDLRRRWEGNTDGLGDPSRNGLDMSLTSLLVRRGFNDVEITRIHRAFPHGKVVQDGRGDDYIRPMLEKCRADRCLSRTEPWTTAHRMLAERFTSDSGTSLLRHWNGDFYGYHDGVYRQLDDDDMKARVWHYLGGARCATGKKKKTEPYKPNRARAGDVLGGLEAAAHLDSQYAMPCWLDGATGDDPNDLLVMANGTLHMPSRTLRPHDPRLFTSTGLPFPYAPDAAPPVAWLRFLESVWGDDRESIETLQEFFGYCLTADCSQQKILLIVGPKRSGKGTIARVLRGVIGEANCAGPTLASLATNFGLQPLIGKRVAIVSDARLGGCTDKHALTERLCSVSGEDALTIDRKYVEPWTGTLGVRLVICTNELPKIVDDSNALSSRFVVLRMVRSFLGEEDLGLADRLLKELPAILNTSLEGLARLKARGAFRQPASALELVQELENLASPVAAFLRDRCVVSPGAQVECERLFGAWKFYCAGQGRHHMGTSASFGASLRAALPQLERCRSGTRDSRVWVYKGVALATGMATVADLAAAKARLL
ncbi:phage/plasmid primase, P4 family [Pseudomonas sp. SP16.1]|uniref:phage/plasmid primase, P4 family n=1 Tax=Pseudomonas sp. SP16.1 TaxID=3458854 RepID=UPI0040466779